MRTRKLCLMGLLAAVALGIFMLEAQIPPVVPVPGVKLGLSNIVTVFAVFALGWKAGAGILFVRIFLGAVLSGNVGSIFYSAGGGLLAIVVTVMLKPLLTRQQIWVASCFGAVAHGIGQMAVAVWISKTPSILIYLPALIFSGVITGLFTGLCAQFLVKRGNTLWKTIFRQT